MPPADRLPRLYTGVTMVTKASCWLVSVMDRLLRYHEAIPEPAVAAYCQ